MGRFAKILVVSMMLAGLAAGCTKEEPEPEVQSPVVGEETREEPTWGEAVQGVQVRLRADKEVWQYGEVPTFQASVRNAGRGQLRDTMGRRVIYELEFDGRWYRDIAPVRKYPLVISPGQQKDAIRISVGQRWWRRDVPNRPDLVPGKHTVRVAFNGTLGDLRARSDARPVRAVSNAIQITIERGLPGSRVSIEDAVRDPRFAFAAVCEMTRQDADWVSGLAPGGLAAQRFRITELLTVGGPDNAEVNLSYEYGSPRSRHERDHVYERPVKKGERVIWIVRQRKAPGYLGVKALPDTPENRKAVVEAVKAHSRMATPEELRMAEVCRKGLMLQLTFHETPPAPKYPTDVLVLSTQTVHLIAGWDFVLIDTGQADAIVDFLLADGFFARAVDRRERKWQRPTGPCYAMHVQAFGGGVLLAENLGSGRGTVNRLRGLRVALSGDTADAMDRFLARLEKHLQQSIEERWGPVSNGLQCRLLPLEQTVEVAEGTKPEDIKVYVTYELRNVSEKPVKFLPWYTPLEKDMGGDILDVIGPDGEKVRYLGEHADRGPPDRKHFISLAAQQKHSQKARLPYDFTKPGVYEVSFSTAEKAGWSDRALSGYYASDLEKAKQNPDNVWTGTLKSNTVTVKVVRPAEEDDAKTEVIQAKAADTLVSIENGVPRFHFRVKDLTGVYLTWRERSDPLPVRPAFWEQFVAALKTAKQPPAGDKLWFDEDNGVLFVLKDGRQAYLVGGERFWRWVPDPKSNVGWLPIDCPALGQAVEAARMLAMAAEADRIIVGNALPVGEGRAPLVIEVARTLKGSNATGTRQHVSLIGERETPRVDLRPDDERLIVFLRVNASGRGVPELLPLRPTKWFVPHNDKMEKNVRQAIPLPDKWGKEASGLRMGLRLRKSQFAPGEDIPVEICIRNVSETPITLLQHRLNIYDCYEHTRFKVVGPRDERWELVAKLVFAMREHDAPLRRTLRPGESYIHTVRLNKWPAKLASTKEADTPQSKPFAQPGDYSVTCTYSVGASARGEHWTGTLTSNTVRVRIVLLDTAPEI